VSAPPTDSEPEPLPRWLRLLKLVLSVLVLALSIDSDNVRRLYAHPEVIWFLCPLVLYLVTRIWVLARRGEMPGDPVLFAATDWRSQAVVGLGAALMLAAAL
jgi:hypothetical protein